MKAVLPRWFRCLAASSPRPYPRRAGRAVVALVALAGLAASSCSSGDATTAAAEGDAADDGSAETAPATIETVPSVTLPDPGILPGTCQLVIYTPPSAPEEQKGELCTPGTVQRDVAILLVHGGSGTHGNYYGMKTWAARYLDEGYTTFTIDYFLFAAADRAPIFPRPEQDVKAAVQYLRGHAESLGIHPERILVHGSSAGARLAATIFTNPNDGYYAGPALQPDIADHVNGFIGHFSTYDGTLENDSKYYDGERDDKDPVVRRRWAEADSIANADGATGPALFFTGTKDWAELVTQQKAFVDGLRRAGLDATSCVAQGGEHGYDQSSGKLTKLGEADAKIILTWLEWQFPQPTSGDISATAPATDPATGDASAGDSTTSTTVRTTTTSTSTSTTTPATSTTTRSGRTTTTITPTGTTSCT